MRPYEPQSWQQMATCLEAAGKTDLAMACYEVGLAGNWNARFGEFKKILTVDYLHFLKEIESGKQSVTNKDFAKMRLASLTNSQAHKPTDLLIIIGWNTDRSDVDLHVQEPSGEICFYKNPLTKLGGKITQDVTQGYGPEMYRLETAKSGIYQIKVKYFASDQNRATTRTKVYATIYRRWGSKNETVQRKTLTLERGKEMHQVATLQIGG